MTVITKLLPLLIITEMLGAGLICLCVSDFKHALYWFAAALVNIAVIA